VGNICITGSRFNWNLTTHFTPAMFIPVKNKYMYNRKINIAGVKWVVRFQLNLLPVIHIFVFYRYKHSRSEVGGWNLTTHFTPAMFIPVKNKYMYNRK
jgi:hypothetical protein